MSPHSRVLTVKDDSVPYKNPTLILSLLNSLFIFQLGDSQWVKEQHAEGDPSMGSRKMSKSLNPTFFLFH